MIKTVVVGVDDSPSAARAARKAAELASALEAELHVLTAFGKFEAETVQAAGEKFYFSTEGDAEATAQKVVAQLRREFPGLSVRLTASEGKPADALVRAAERLDADLIVVGNKRVQGIARVLGSIARDVAAKAPCDLYVAHTHTTRRG